MKKHLIIFFSLLSISLYTQTHEIMYKIMPSYLDTHEIATIKNWMNMIEQQGKAFSDYDGRTGITWDDYRIALHNTQATSTRICHETQKLTIVSGDIKEQHPESVFDYPEISEILMHSILPKAFEQISVWQELPQTMFLQTWINRFTLKNGDQEPNNIIDWHQDPGSLYPNKSHYTLVLMLSDHEDPTLGWKGGDFLIKQGLPKDNAPFYTLVPKFNQAILFDNLHNSHAVSHITTQHQHAQRDVLVITFYLQDPNA